MTGPLRNGSSEEKSDFLEYHYALADTNADGRIDRSEFSRFYGSTLDANEVEQLARDAFDECALRFARIRSSLGGGCRAGRRGGEGSRTGLWASPVWPQSPPRVVIATCGLATAVQV